MKELEKIIFPITRNKFPTTVRENIISEYSKDLVSVRKDFNRYIIRGGYGHDFIKGFFFSSYRLVNEIGYNTQYENGIYSLDTIEQSIIIEELEKDLLEIPIDIKEKWDQMITVFNKE